MTERFVVCGLAPPRSEWFRRLGQWAMTGAVPIEFYKCQSADELRVRLDGPRPVSAALVDPAAPGVDRDLMRGGARCSPVLVVVGADARGVRDWIALGAAGQLDHAFDASTLLDSLAAVAAPLPRATEVPGDCGQERLTSSSPGEAGLVVAVTGPGGTGASTLAAALAEGVASLGGRHRRARVLRPPVVLADLALRADQAMLHDAADPLVTAQELVDACRTKIPDPRLVRDHCTPVEERGYSLLLGLRRSRAWAALRPSALAVAVHGLRAAYGTVVADITADFEGEAETGSVDVEERNAMARITVAWAACVVAVGGAGLSGTHRLVRLVHDIAAAGVLPSRILPVVNRAPRSPHERAQITSALARLCDLPEGRPAPPLFLPERPVDAAFRDGAPIPAPLPALLTEAAAAVIGRVPVMPDAEWIDGREPRLVQPGSFGALVPADNSEAPRW